VAVDAAVLLNFGDLGLELGDRLLRQLQLLLEVGDFGLKRKRENESLALRNDVENQLDPILRPRVSAEKFCNVDFLSPYPDIPAEIGGQFLEPFFVPM
jgi:hypothetical protein